MKRTLLAAVLAPMLALSVGCPTLFGPGTDGPEPFEPSAVVTWNEAMLAAVRNGPARPTVIARSLYVVHSSMYDAWTAYDLLAVPTVAGTSLKQPVSAMTEENKRAAVSYAAYAALVDQFPQYEADTQAFSRLLNSLGYEVDNSTDTTTPAGVGNVAAQRVLDFRENDGSNETGNYAQITSDTFPALYAPVNSADPTAANAPGGPDYDPNRWQPLRVPTGTLVDMNGTAIFDNSDPASFVDQEFLTPHWGAIVPFAMDAGDQFQPPAPPQANSMESYTDALGNTMTNDEAFNMQIDQVVQFSADLTDQQKVIAEYWADGPRSETPPGHWNALSHGVSYRARNTLDDDVKLFFALNGALMDASISAWDAKRVYDYVRPASAIRNKFNGQEIQSWGGPDQGTQTIMGEDWLPYQDVTFVTPPFSEFVSGHSTFSAAAAAVLTRAQGSNTFYDGETILFNDDYNEDGLPDLIGQHVIGIGGNLFEGSPESVIILEWNTFQDAADEAGISRLYGGIHIQDGDLRGREMGENIGTLAYDTAEAYWNGTRESRFDPDSE